MILSLHSALSLDKKSDDDIFSTTFAFTRSFKPKESAISEAPSPSITITASTLDLVVESNQAGLLKFALPETSILVSPLK